MEFHVSFNHTLTNWFLNCWYPTFSNLKMPGTFYCRNNGTKLKKRIFNCKCQYINLLPIKVVLVFTNQVLSDMQVDYIHTLQPFICLVQLLDNIQHRFTMRMHNWTLQLVQPIVDAWWYAMNDNYYIYLV